jgi:hypothetical protein
MVPDPVPTLDLGPNPTVLDFQKVPNPVLKLTLNIYAYSIPIIFKG